VRASTCFIRATETAEVLPASEAGLVEALGGIKTKMSSETCVEKPARGDADYRLRIRRLSSGGTSAGPTDRNGRDLRIRAGHVSLA
jgi:hypothetical protein